MLSLQDRAFLNIICSDSPQGTTLLVQVGDKNAVLGRVQSMDLHMTAEGTEHYLKITSFSEETHEVLKCFEPFVQSTLLEKIPVQY